jgi:LPXTG-motif cell wall-anchored protein
VRVATAKDAPPAGDSAPAGGGPTLPATGGASVFAGLALLLGGGLIARRRATLR